MRRTAAAWYQYKADRVIFERNQGGDYLPALLHTVDRHIPTRNVSAMRGKALRAEPVSSLYEQHRIHHAGHFPDLEDQMTTWAPGDQSSPDRLDALVWALTDLIVEQSHTESYFATLAPPCSACHQAVLSTAVKCPYCGEPRDQGLGRTA